MGFLNWYNYLIIYDPKIPIPSIWAFSASLWHDSTKGFYATGSILDVQWRLTLLDKL
jgi:hypothetical protein